MALISITSADFKGYIRLSQNSFKTSELELYIEEFYPMLVSELIGDNALNDLLTTDPLPQKYTDLFEGTGIYFNDCLEQNRMKPRLLSIIKKFIFFYWVREFAINTTSGEVRNNSENATNLTRAEIENVARTRYNIAVMDFNTSVVPFLDQYKTVTQVVDSITDLGATQQINTSSTLYLSDSDTVTINGIDYVVFNLIEDTSFEITSTTIIASEFTYAPFKDLVYSKIDPAL